MKGCPHCRRRRRRIRRLKRLALAIAERLYNAACVLAHRAERRKERR